MFLPVVLRSRERFIAENVSEEGCNDAVFFYDCLRKPVSPRKARDSSTFVGRGILTTASNFDGAGRISVL